jgi:hypothetical protein
VDWIQPAIRVLIPASYGNHQFSPVCTQNRNWRCIQPNTVVCKTEYKWKICGYLKPTVGMGLLYLNTSAEKSPARMGDITIQIKIHFGKIMHALIHSFIHLLLTDFYLTKLYTFQKLNSNNSHESKNIFCSST